MPLKQPLYFVHGLVGNRNTMRQRPNGQIGITSRARWFRLPPGPRDTGRKLWGGNELTLGLGFPPVNLLGGRDFRDG